MKTLKASKSLWPSALLAGLLLGLAGAVAPGAADIIIDDGGDPGFTMKVEAALQKIRDAGGKPAAILDDLESSGNDHVISKGGNGTGYNDVGDANSMDAGGTGKGTGTSVGWDPDESGTTKGGVPYDPCITLAHELSHAQDGDNGMRDPRPDPGNMDIPTNEVEACADENRFRKAMGKPPRTDYNCEDLPESAVCPPDVIKAEDMFTPIPDEVLGMNPITWKAPARARRSGALSAIPAPAPMPVASVRLSAVATSAQYLLGEPVEIRLTLTNQSVQPLGLSKLAEGNVQIVSIQRNGLAVATRKTKIDFFDGLGFRLSQSLVTVPPGSGLQVRWGSAPDPVLAGQALGTVQFSAGDDDGLTLHGLLLPGNYSVTFNYQYPGPTHSYTGTVYTRKTNNATVSFRIL